MSGSTSGSKRAAAGHRTVFDLPIQAPLILGLATSLSLLVAACATAWAGRCGSQAHAGSTAPERPVITGFAEDTGIQGDRITSDNTPTLAGRAERNVGVRVHRGNSVLGETNSDEDGSWRVAIEHPLPDGPHSLTAAAADEEGNVSDRSEPLALTIDTVAPARPVIFRFDEDTGLPNDNTTNDTTLTITGSAEAQSEIEVFVDGTSLGWAMPTRVVDGVSSPRSSKMGIIG